MKLMEILSEYKRANSVTNEFIAKQIGVTESTVYRWIKGETRKVQDSVVDKLTDLIQVDVKYLLSLDNQRPIIGFVKAGYNLLAEQNIIDYESVSEDDYNRGNYFLKVTGQSMKDAGIVDGSLLYVQACNDVESGQIAIILINGEGTVKRVIKQDKIIILEAANPNEPNKYFTSEDLNNIQIIGKVLYCKTVF